MAAQPTLHTLLDRIGLGDPPFSELVDAFAATRRPQTPGEFRRWLAASDSASAAHLATLLDGDEITVGTRLPQRLHAPEASTIRVRSPLHDGRGPMPSSMGPPSAVRDPSVGSADDALATAGALTLGASTVVAFGNAGTGAAAAVDTVALEPGVAALPSHDPSRTDAPAPAGETARYVILGEAGRGGMAIVHVARDTELLRKVALKSLEGEPDATPDMVQRFLREVQITAQLDHPHIVPVYGLEVTPQGTPAYAMKLIEGRTLATYLDEAHAGYTLHGRTDEAHQLPARIEHFLKVCDAVSYAHGKGVIHRDLKPSNVMIGRHHEIYVMDWGICRMLGDPAEPNADLRTSAEVPLPGLHGADDSGSTREGSIIGTPRYMSPEQATGRQSEVGPASDQCALGLILFEIVTLAPALVGNSMLAVLGNAARSRLQPIVHAYGRSRIPAELVAIIRKSTAPRPADRYPDVDAMAQDLRRYLRGAAVTARPDNLFQRAARWFGHNRQRALAGVLVLAAFGVTAELVRMERERDRLARAHGHEAGMQQLAAAVAHRRDLLATTLLRVQGGAESFAAAAEEAIVRGAPTDERYFSVADFNDPARAPPDLATEPGWDAPISRAYAAWNLPPDVPRTRGEAKVRRLVALRGHRARLFIHVESMVETADAAGPATGDSLPNVVIGMNVGLSDGIASIYPGRGTLPPDYDPRTRPWYTIAHNGGAQWGPPFMPRFNNAVQIPVSAALRDGPDVQIGVASVLLSAERIARTFLDPKGLPSVDRLLLLDGAGGILLDGGDTAQLSGPDRREPEVVPFPDARLQAGLARSGHGQSLVRWQGRSMLAFWDRLPIADWALLALSSDPRLVDDAVPEASAR